MRFASASASHHRRPLKYLLTAGVDLDQAALAHAPAAATL